MADRCGSCGAPVAWRLTVKGRSIPIDATEDGELAVFVDGNLVLGDLGVVRVVPAGVGLHRTHFASCPEADQFRRPKR